jgi:hypothetical protein
MAGGFCKKLPRSDKTAPKSTRRTPHSTPVLPAAGAGIVAAVDQIVNVHIRFSFQ